MSNYKKIALIIEVPKGKYCWQGAMPCEYFNNEGGHGRCDIPGMYVREETKGGCNVLKDPRCAAASEQGESDE